MEITVDYLKDKVHEQYLELQELRKSYDELTKSALRLDKMVKEKQEEIDQLKAREKEHQRLNGELREENKKLKSLCDKYEKEHKTVFEEWKKTINIINELEKYLQENINSIYAYFDNTPFGIEETYKEVLSKLQELKGSDKE